MSLQTRLEAFAAVLGADTKALAVMARDPSVDAGFLGATMDPAACWGANAPATQLLVLTKIKCVLSGNVTKLCCGVGTPAASLTYARLALYSMAGSQLGISADMISAFTTNGYKEGVLTGSAIPVVAGTEYILGILQVGTTPANLIRGYNSSFANAGYASAPFRFSQIAAQSSMPATINPGGLAMSTFGWWVGMR